MKILFFVLSLAIAARGDCTLKISTDGPIGPGTFDYIERALSKAEQQHCKSILYLINTPGGSLQSTRLIVEKIVNSPVPFLCLVYPGGGHAGSAGAIILQACHVNGAVAATNIGAATPVSMGGEMTEDMRNKIMNDTVSWMQSLTDLRGRSRAFGRDIIEKAKAVDAESAHKLGAIDHVPHNIDEFLQFANGRKVKFSENETRSVLTGSIADFEPDIRFRILDFVTHPQIAYLIFMASLALLYFEITHTGMIAPGVFGALGLIVSLISFHMLDVHWGAVALIVLGLGFLIAELFVPSFGALGVGGIVSFVAGSLLLYDPTVGALPLATILPTAIGLGLTMLFFGFLAMKAQRVELKNTNFVGEVAKVVRVDSDKQTGKAEIHGEIWNFRSSDDVGLNDYVVIKQVEGLKLLVSRSQSRATS